MSFDTTSSGSPPLDACPYLPVFGPPQVMFVRGQGTELWDPGPALPRLPLRAGGDIARPCPPGGGGGDRRAGGTLLHVSNFFANPVATEAAVDDRRAAGSGRRGRQVFFCNSGAEANEAAFKVARKFGGRGRHVVVSAFGSFHGRTLAALAATGQPTKHEPFQPMPEGFRHVASATSTRSAGGHRPERGGGADRAGPGRRAASSRRRAGYFGGHPARCATSAGC